MTPAASQYSLGVLIIGSLYWRGGRRAEWRRRRLNFDREYSVLAPIKYGRLSRSGTYTMVFAELQDKNLGKAKVVACQNAVLTYQDLLVEAQWLWAAESNSVPSDNDIPSQQISSSWGSVALLRNPKTEISSLLLESWANELLERSDRMTRKKLMIDSSGLLKIGWPKYVNTGVPLDLDLLLATSTVPSHPLPNPRTIADAWNDQANGVRFEYFDRNSKSGISTYEDEDIETLLRRQQNLHV